MRLIYLFSFMALGACNYNHIKQSQQSTGVGGFQKMEALDFQSVKGSVLEPRCFGCHSDATGNKGGANLERYENVRRLANRIAYRSLEKRDMPQAGPLSPQEAEILKNWLEMGAPEIAMSTETEGDPSLEQGPTDWTKIKEKIFGKKCLDCHSQPQPQGNLDLSSYEETKAKAALIFDRVILKQDMPLEPYPALSMRERKVLLNWMNMGLPQ